MAIILVVVSIGLAYASLFIDSTASDFNNGTYQNTTFNGSSVVLSGGNTSGIYTSRIFDAGILADWNNINFSRNISLSEELSLLYDIHRWG